MLDDGEAEVYGEDDDVMVTNAPQPDVKTKPTSSKKSSGRTQSATVGGRKITKSELTPPSVMPVVIEETKTGEKRKKSSSGDGQQSGKSRNRKRSEGRQSTLDSLTSQSDVQDGSEPEKNSDQIEENNDEEEEVRRPEAHDNLDDIINRMFNIIAKITSEEIPEENSDSLKPEKRKEKIFIDIIFNF